MTKPRNRNSIGARTRPSRTDKAASAKRSAKTLGGPGAGPPGKSGERRRARRKVRRDAPATCTTPAPTVAPEESMWSTGVHLLREVFNEMNDKGYDTTRIAYSMSHVVNMEPAIRNALNVQSGERFRAITLRLNAIAKRRAMDDHCRTNRWIVCPRGHAQRHGFYAIDTIPIASALFREYGRFIAGEDLVYASAPAL